MNTEDHTILELKVLKLEKALREIIRVANFPPVDPLYLQLAEEALKVD